MRHRTLCVKMSADELSFLLICIPTILPNVRISGRWILRSFPPLCGLRIFEPGYCKYIFLQILSAGSALRKSIPVHYRNRN